MTEKPDLETAELIAATLKSLGNSTRLRLLAILLEGETCVSDLAEMTGISQSAVSHQLRVLRNLRFVSTRREGKQVFYHIDDDHIEDLYNAALEHSYHLNEPRKQ